MFEIPEAKRVRRDELFDHSGSESENNVPDEAAAAQARLQEQLSSLIEFEFPTAEQNGAAEAAEPAAVAEEEVFEFKLFATSKSGGGAAVSSRVVLAPKEDEAAGADQAGDAGGFVVPSRPQSYYVAGPPTAEQQAQFEAVAVTGEQVLAWAEQRCWGLEVPWRLTRLVISSSGPAAATVKMKESGDGAKTDGSGDATKKKKRRPGKRKRIAVRIRTKKEKEHDKEKQTKEEHLKAKKKRLNRERQLKRRQKEREKKQAMRAEGDGETSVQSADAMSS